MENKEQKEFHQKFHFIAIGGIGMSGLAKYLLELGYAVSGTDISASKYTKQLEDMGAKIYVGHSAEYIEPDMTIVSSTAIKDTNPEIIKAKEYGLKIHHRSDILELISTGFGKEEKPKFIGVAGTHGKTTTSGLCTYVLEKAMYNPSFCVGGRIPEIDTNARATDGKYFVAELDESDGTITKYSPDISIITNLEMDHIDFYTDGFKGLIDTFNTHIANTPENAIIVINNDCVGNSQLIKENPTRKFVTFGLNWADYTAKNIVYEEDHSHFDIIKKGVTLGTVELSIPGKHNVYNALSVIAALVEDGVPFERIVPHFKAFSGMGRRFQLVSEFDNIKIIDDYAHHPSEIKTTLESARSFAQCRLIAVFQPHRYTRLQGLWDDFLNAFDMVDKLYVMDVYAASEEPIEGINAESFIKALKIQAVHAKGNIKEAAAIIAQDLRNGDIVITLGAGDVTNIGKEIEENYKTSVY